MEQKENFEDDIGVIRCATGDCTRVLLGMHKSYWFRNQCPLTCQKCGKEAVIWGFILTSSEKGLLAVRLFCRICQILFDHKIPVKKSYCSGCKSEIQIFPYLDLFSPHLLKERLKSAA